MSAQVQSNELEYCKFQVQYLSDPKDVEDKRNEALFELNKELKKRPLFGFRKGKAPLNLIKNKFKKEIENFVSPKMLAKAYEEILFETKIDPIGTPQIVRSELVNDKYFCEMYILGKPKFELGEYKNFEIPAWESEKILSVKTSKQELMFEGYLQQLREKHSELTPFEDSDELKMGDQATLDLRIIEDQEVENANIQEGILYTVGSGMYEGFDSELLGMKIDDSRLFDLKVKHQKLKTYPVDRFCKRPTECQMLFGVCQCSDEVRAMPEFKTLSFRVKLNMGLRPVPCSSDEELAERVGEASFEGLKTKILAHCEQEVKRMEKINLQQAVSEKLLSNHQFKIPDWLISGETEQLCKTAGVKEPTEQLIKQAEKNVRLSLILEEIRTKEPDAQVSDMELINLLKRQVKDDPKLGQLIVEMEKSGQIGMWLAQSRVNFVLDWVIGTSKVVGFVKSGEENVPQV